MELQADPDDEILRAHGSSILSIRFILPKQSFSIAQSASVGNPPSSISNLESEISSSAWGVPDSAHSHAG